jgi:cytochrome b561
MDVFYAIAFPLIIILGILSALAGLLIFLSCRCLPAWKPASKLMSNKKYQRFFKTHCKIWWVFWALVIIHAVVAWIYFFTS